MKTFCLKTFLCSLIVATTLSAEPLIEAKAGYFFFTNSTLRKVYDKGGIDLQLSATHPLTTICDDWTLNAYAAIEYLYLNGRSIHGHQKTSLWAVPVNLGLKPTYTINCNTQFYFAVGPRYLNLHQRNHSSFVYKKYSKNTLGFFVNSGIHYTLCNGFVIDLFCEYSYAKMHFHGRSRVYTRDLQVGGFTFGLGLGYPF